MKNSYFSKFIFAFILLLVTSSGSLFAQGVTTSAMNGTVTDASGDPLPNANVIAVHEPSGTQYGVSTMINGRFNLLKLRPGGPYTVTVSFVGYNTQTEENIKLQLSQNLELQFVLTESEFEISGVTVVAEKSSILSGSRTGATQNITSQDIATVPTINRQFQDFSKLSPQFSGTNSSAAGRNNRYNNIQIDGTQHNDLFGLGATGAPGGQVNTAPISLDAIEEFQVVIAPYDVRFGSFTGGGINAITRSGTNKFHGSVYGFGRNQNYVGDAGFLDENKEFPEFTRYQYGLRIGGPLVENKLFFFLSGELTTRDQPFTNRSLQTGDDISSNTASANRLMDVLNTQYGYNSGGFGARTAEQPSDKLFVRLDWNISQQHVLSLRNNYVNASRDFLNNRGSSSRLAFTTYNYSINSETNSLAAQLNSTFGNNMSNELIIGFTTIRDRRAGLEDPLPEVEVDEGSLTMHVGPDRFSSANELDQDIFEITDNFTYITGDHALTFGTHNEFFSFRNLFIRSFFGYYTYDSIDDLENDAAPSFFQRVFSRTDDPKQPAEFSVNQFGVYAQDEWSVAPNFKVNAGIRLDIPLLPDTPEENDSIPVYFPGFSTTTVPDGNLLFSPRVGFNWDVSANRTTQIRGGVGIFTGRIPYVWMSNNYGNTGTLYAEVRQASGENVGFHPDPFDQPGPGDPGTGSARLQSEVDLVDGDFKFPQVLRFNAAVDRQLPLGIIGTVEFLYSKSVNDLVYEKINLEDPDGTIVDDGRTHYGGTNSGNGNFFDVLLLKNTDEGYEYSLSFQLQRTVARGVSVNTAYTFGQSKDVNSVLSSQARSQIRRNPIVDDPNNPPLGYSRFDPGHRIFISISYIAEFFKNAPTTFSIYYNGQSGQRFSFTVDNDLNNDGFDNNDLFFIPANDDDILLGELDDNGVYVPADQSEYAALFSFIDNNDYLSENKGKMSERNGARNPWRNILDLKIIQDIPTFGFGHIQLSLDILNVINLLDSGSGWNETTQFPNYEIVDWDDIDPVSGRPIYSFNSRDNNVPWDPDDLTSRWAMQFGVRWFF
ncbi:MAG: carboxypeptidase regulatory-like domain-containing protein [Bacteroidetes bacterium]|nr:carboxypeptidase regulatory-like domain-containing protein [Bacteroidota bacterium]